MKICQVKIVFNFKFSLYSFSTVIVQNPEKIDLFKLASVCDNYQNVTGQALLLFHTGNIKRNCIKQCQLSKPPLFDLPCLKAKLHTI